MADENILEALETALRTNDGIDRIVGAFFGLAKTVDAETKSRMLEALDGPLRAHPVERMGPVAMLAGALVEVGADPLRFPAAVFDLIVDELATIDVTDEDFELPEYFFSLERSAMACLSRSTELRRTLPQKAAIIAKQRRYQERYGFLGKMVRVLDDEPLVVIHPSTARGFRFRMHGIADNFQVHLLLLGALAGDGPDRIEGFVPSRATLAAASDGPGGDGGSAQSNWQLANWFGLRAGGEIDRADYHRTWIWNEGVPADIAVFEGTRVVLIGVSTIQRSWNAQRVFNGMHGRLDGPTQIAQEEVVALLEKMHEARARES